MRHGCNVARFLREPTGPSSARDQGITMNNKTKPEATTETIDTAKLEDVTGGCAACGSPGGACRLQQQQNRSWGPAPQPAR
jgi:hypothetical protein